MDKNKSQQSPENRSNSSRLRIARDEIERAHREAERDISADPEFSAHSPTTILMKAKPPGLVKTKPD